MICNPKPLVDHVYQKSMDKYLDEITHKNFGMNTDLLRGESKVQLPGSGLLKALYSESKVQLPGSALHNNNINYYDHTEDNLDTTPVYTPSKMYVFLDMKANMLCKFNASEQEAKIPDCTLVIRPPNLAVTNSFLVLCQRISKYQPIVGLHMFGVSSKYQSETDGFNLSENAQSLVIKSCRLPAQPLNCLMQKLSVCNTIHKIDLSNTSLEDVLSLTLSNKTSLTHLNLSKTKMSTELCKKICQQLTNITHLQYLSMAENDLSHISNFTLSKALRYLNLQNIKMSADLCQGILQQVTSIADLEHLNMSNNDLSHVSKFTLSNKKTLKYLHLENTHMSLTLYYCICQQLTDLESLKQFFVSREDSCYKICKDPLPKCFLSDKHLPTHVCTHVLRQINRFSNLHCIELADSLLTGCLSSFLPDPHPGLPDLNNLTLKHTTLNKEDVKHLFSVIQCNKLQKLWDLDLSNNTLTGCLSSFLPDPHPGLPELRRLRLKSTALNKDDLQHLLSVTYKLPKLSQLDLSGYTLTGCLSSFLTDPHPGLHELEELNLWSTALNKDDLQHLFNIIQSNKLPKLWILDLSNNTLTGCLSSFLPYTHPGLPELRGLHLKSTTLNKDDLQHLLSVAYKLPKLSQLDLSGYTLTGCLSSFLTDPHPGLHELEELNLRSTALNKNDLQHLFSIIQSNKLPKLWILDLSNNTLTGSLSRFLPDPHPGLPELLFLHLKRTALNKEDLQHLFSIIQLNKLPKLQWLDLSHNTLRGCLSSFLADPHPGLPELLWLHLKSTALNKDDLQHFSHITQNNKLPKLQDLDLSQNTLTGCLSSFLPDPHTGLSELEELHLSSTALNKDDLQHFSHITQSNKLPRLKILDLSDNNLTGCLCSFLQSLPEVKYLLLCNTELNKEDLQHIKHLVQYGKLPGLLDLHLKGNGLYQMKEELRDLIETCVTNHQGHLWLYLNDNDLSTEFENQLKQCCEGTKIHVKF